MPIDPATLSALSGIFGGLGGGLGAGANARQQLDMWRGNMAQNQRQFNAQHGLDQRAQNQSEAAQAMGIQRALATLPLQDRAAYLLNARLGMTPSSFNPRDLLNNPNGPTSGGGYNQADLASANSAYTSGAGGILGNQTALLAMLRQMGYDPNKGYTGPPGGTGPGGAAGAPPPVTDQYGLEVRDPRAAYSDLKRRLATARPR